LIPAGNIEALTVEVIKLLKNPDRAAYLGRKARLKIMERYSTETMTSATLAIYDEILK
jgi:glycosyltransferase involved in cell wall biosynthesis